MLRRATGLRWQVKAVIPVAGVLLLGLVVLQALVREQGFANRHWIFIVAALCAVMICLVLLSVFLVLIERPLGELKKTIERVREGDLNARVLFAKRDDDVGQLGRQFNEMIDQLKENRAEIERLHQIEMQRAEHLATIGELAAGLAHEIRNPLAGIAGVVHVIGTELPAASPSRALLGEVQGEIRHIQDILNDLLAYARPRPPQFHRANLNETVEQAVLLARQQVRMNPIEIHFTPNSDVPDLVHDPIQLQQVVLNLLLNGIQAIPHEGKVDVTLRREGNHVIFCVADTGRGIPAEELAKIFKPFFTTRREGTGLGLPLAKGIVEAHGGRIEVTSVLGRGTQFEVWLPMDRAARGSPV
jgi:signal transduction histidine kinase